MKITRETVRKIEGIVPEGRVAAAELLRRAFDLVSPTPNWKVPIRKYLVLDGTDFHPEVIADSITFMTGSVANIQEQTDGSVLFTAAGYYAAIGA